MDIPREAERNRRRLLFAVPAFRRVRPWRISWLLRALARIVLLSIVHSAAAAANTPTLVETDQIGFTLDEDWRQWWRRVLDRGGRPVPTGPLQQRFANPQYPEHEADQLVGDFMLAREAHWARSTNQVRFWLHSYDALELGTKFQMKLGHDVGGDWRVGFRYDGLDNRATASHLLSGDFTWSPGGKGGLYTTLSIYPRLEKQDTDLVLTVGYDAGPFGDARVRIVGLDPFTNAAYLLASNRKPPAPLFWKQLDLPLAASLELSSGRWRGFHSELYLGVMPSQRRALFLGGMVEEHIHDEAASMLGAMLEWQASEYPLWLGVTGLVVANRWKAFDTDDVAGSRQRIRERNVMTRAYMIVAPRRDMLIEGQLRVTARPESVSGAAGAHTEREDNELAFGARGQWLLSSWLGTELAYWHTDRSTSGPPDVSVDGSLDRFVTRLVFDSGGGMLVSVGVDWDPAPRRSVPYAGGGATIRIDMD
jgi:hypothetical protein